MHFPTAQTNLAVTLVAAAVLSFYLEILRLSWIYDHFLPLLTAATTITVLLVVVLYTSSFSQSRVLALGGNTDSGIYNFFIGRELNPRIGTFDLKHFCELYPGLIGWLIIDLGMLQKQYEKHGYVSTSMALVCMFQFVYVLDALWFEAAIFSTMDIVHDGFGFMLAFGDLVWVPFTYSLQARYLVDRPQVSSSSYLTNRFPSHLAMLCTREKHKGQDGLHTKGKTAYTQWTNKQMLYKANSCLQLPTALHMLSGVQQFPHQQHVLDVTIDIT